MMAFAETRKAITRKIAPIDALQIREESESQKHGIIDVKGAARQIYFKHSINT